MIDYSVILKNIVKSEEDLDINNKIVIIDGLNIFLRNFVVNTSTNLDGVPVGGTIGFLKTLTKMLRILQPTRVIIVFDGAGGSKRRRAIYEDYKSNRKGINIKNRIYGDEFNNENLIKLQIIKLIEYLKLLPITIITIDDIEADDVISFISNSLPEKCKHAYIVSADKDFYQLIDDNLSVFSPTKDKIIKENDVVEEFGIIPNNFNIVKCILGDKSDNIPGVNGIGIKKINKYLQFLNEKSYNMSEFLEKVESLKDDDVVYKTLLDNSDLLHRNYKLMNLTYNDISASNKFKILDYINEVPKKSNAMEFNKLIIYDRMNTHFDNAYSWLSEYFTKLNKFAK